MLALLELESLWELRSILKDIEAKVSDLNDADRELIQKMFRAGKNFDDILKAVESNHAPKASSGFDPT